MEVAPRSTGGGMTHAGRAQNGLELKVEEQVPVPGSRRDHLGGYWLSRRGEMQKLPRGPCLLSDMAAACRRRADRTSRSVPPPACGGHVGPVRQDGRMTETNWALVGALAGALVAGGISLLGVLLTHRHTERLGVLSRRERQQTYLKEQRRLAYGQFIAAVLDAETRIDQPNDNGDAVPLSAAEIYGLQKSVVHAQGSMLIFGSGPAVRASSRSMGEIIGALRGVQTPSGRHDGLGELVATARREFAVDPDCDP